MILAWIAGCGGPACPPATDPDPVREDRLRERIATVDPEVATTGATVCFGRVEDGVHDEVVQLGPADEPEQAARLAHLLVHVDEPFAVTPGPGCSLDVDRAVAAERVVLAREAAWRARWAVAPLPVDALDRRRVAYERRCAE